ncbi:cancer-associated gene protein, putative [Pediculus humanus corporis]|uniref:Cancer-associated gene protein, putative n=1 Tax=Pediculus humanus subsp. corporis TaxID=121224 RepID=E0W0K6_PEDHC|nr:cancer-associated gene protein, putative [Pediculus humanus corporis]EEB19162.1 cancer-associated gene protein, putative [Pediculus humanus corporis]
MPVPCSLNCGKNAVLKRPKTGHALCKDCFFKVFESEIHDTIINAKLFKPGDYVAIAASGATGHNADDIAETVLMNILRGDLARLQRCTAIVTVRF